MAKYEQYAEYKDSGVKWLGEIPEHWEVVPIKHLANLNPKKSMLSQDLMANECSFVPMEKLKFNSIILDEKKVIKDVYDGYTYFENEDILVAKVTPCFENKNTAIARNLINGIGFGSSEIYVLRANEKTKNRYLFYRLQETIFISVAMTGAGGLRRVPAETINTYPIAVPNIDEQTQIAKFLNHETAQIDILIDKQQTLIQLLKEKRQAVISHAVTKGLNPNAPMKDSGVEWLWEVPEHWGITKIKYVAELTPSKAKILSSLEKRCSFIPMEKLKLDTLILDETRDIKDVYQGYTYFEDGDVLLAKVTPCFENQNMAIATNLVNGIGFGSSEIYVLRTEAEGLNQFLLYRLQESVFMQLGAGAMTGAGGLRRVPSDFINDFQFALPPIVEQQEIVEHIEKMKSKFNDLVDSAEQAIQLMQERRTALISAAVTGKIDVRGWVAPK